MPRPELRLGLAADAGAAQAVVLDARGGTLGSATAAGGAMGAMAAEVVGAALADAGAGPGTIGRLTFAGGGVDLEADGALGPVAVLRIGAPMTLGVPPLTTWPPALARTVAAAVAVVAGDPDPYSGAPVPLDTDAVRRFAAALGDTRAVAITGVFAPTDGDLELEAAEIVRQEAGPGVAVTLSQDLGTLGLIERENATVVNAALALTAERADRDVWAVLASAAPEATAYVACTDGTVIAQELAVRHPVLTLHAAHAASLRGAARLARLDAAVVADVGPTSSTVGVLTGGAPRLSTRPLTLSGIVLGLAVPDARRLPAPPAAAQLAGEVERAGGGDDLPLVLVGMDAGAVPAEALRPVGGEVAAAVGAATAPVAGSAERLCSDRDDTRRIAHEEARRAAFGRAVSRGAEPATVEITEVDEVPLTGLHDPGIRIRVRAVGRSAV